MGNFAVAASQETIEFANKIMELYAQEGDKKEDTLLRILNLAEMESVKGTHPELEGALKTVDTTITTLIKQINGIVAGQDSQLAELKKKLDEALEEKRAALDTAKAQTDAATTRTEAAEVAIKQAASDVELAKIQAQAEIDATKKDAAIEVERANTERDQAIRERDDARTIADEKAASNDLLMRQMTAMEADTAAYKELQIKHRELQSNYASLSEKAKDDARTASEELKDARRDTAEAKKETERIQASLAASQKAQEDIASENRRLESRIAALEQASVKAAGEAELATEKAVIAKEHEMMDQIRHADRENAKLAAQIEQLQAQIIELRKSTSDKK